MKFNSVCVVGLVYIGMPTVAVVAAQNISILRVDTSEKAINTIDTGKIYIVEKDLVQQVQKLVTSGYLKAQTKPVVPDAFMLAVTNPFKGDYESDISLC